MPGYSPTPIAHQRPSTETGKPFAIGGMKLFGDDGFNFRDVLDLINPLQHIPVVGNLYRKLTGDVAAPAIRVAGGALFGGPLGAAFAAANVALGRMLKPAMDSGVAAADTALAAQDVPPATESRGGWMIAQQRAYPVGKAADAALARVAAEATAAAVDKTYSLEGIEAERRHLFGGFHQQA